MSLEYGMKLLKFCIKKIILSQKLKWKRFVSPCVPGLTKEFLVQPGSSWLYQGLRAELLGLPVREGFKKKYKKSLDLSNAHLTPASQAERWIKKIQKLHNFFMSLLSL